MPMFQYLLEMKWMCFFLLFEEIEMGVAYISGRNELGFNWRDTIRMNELFTFRSEVYTDLFVS